jgi:hypothetical protein
MDDEQKDALGKLIMVLTIAVAATVLGDWRFGMGSFLLFVVAVALRIGINRLFRTRTPDE